VVIDNFIFAIFKSFGLHIIVGVALVASVALKPSEKTKPLVIQVEAITSVAVDKNKLAKQVNRIKNEKAAKLRAEEKRVADLEARAAEAKTKTRNENKRLKDLNQQTKKSKEAKRVADAEAKKSLEKQKRENAKAKRAEQLAKKKHQEKIVADKALADTVEKRRVEEVAAQKARLDRIAKEKKREEDKLRKAKLASQAKARKAKEAKLRADQEAAMQQQMLEEQQDRQRAHQKVVMGEVQKYKALIHQRISQRLITDETFKGLSCRVNVKLAFNGLVTSVKVLSGDKRLCNAAENAVLKAGKLPVSEDPAVFKELRDITLIFNI
jgi:colicin import membrane protein